MFEPFKGLTLKLQDFFTEYLSPSNAELRSEEVIKAEQSPPTTGSDSPVSDEKGRKGRRLVWGTPMEKEQSDFSPSFTASICETTDSVLIQPLPYLLVTPATRFPCQSSSPSESRPSTSTSVSQEDLSAAVLSAARHNDEAGCRTLLAPGKESELKVSHTDPEGRSALHWAALNGSIEICKLLFSLDPKSSLSSRDKLGRTPLHCACLGEHFYVAKFLIESGGDVNSTDVDGNTPLHLAAIADSEDLVSLLLKSNANQRSRNHEGRIAMDLAGGQTAKRLRDQGKRSRNSIGKVPKNVNKIPIKQSSQHEIDILMGKSSILSMAETQVSMSPKKSGPEDFELLHLLGKGSFGEVYLVRRRVEGKLFAMKVLRKELIVGQNLVKYAKTERNVLSYIKHPFIVSLFAAFQTSDRLFLILDYCPGGDMGFHLSKEKRFSEHRARIYATEILLAIEELHERGIIFRDLKPENIVFDAQGHAMLTDFGLSKEGVGETSGATSFCGSLAYLAPEIIRRRGHGKAVDWYLFGVLVYEMLTGSPPFFCPNRDQLLRNILYARLSVPDYLSDEAKSLINEVTVTQLLERNPSERLGSGPKGSEEIKQHAFFRGVNWNSVLHRQLRPPVLEKPPSPSILIPKEKVFGANAVIDPVTHVDGWSFVST